MHKAILATLLGVLAVGCTTGGVSTSQHSRALVVGPAGPAVVAVGPGGVRYCYVPGPDGSALYTHGGEPFRVPC